MTDTDPEEYEVLEVLEGMEEAMDSESPLDLVSEEYGHGVLPWAWMVVGLTPLLVVSAAFLWHALQNAYAEARLLGGVVSCSIAILLPTAGALLAIVAMRRGERGSIVALVLSVALVVCVGAALSFFVDSAATLALAGFAYLVAMVGIILFAQSVARR
ncbi:MAG: hypothetical protein ACR2KE_07930 [Candidatus Nanopelagicales bacterium]